MSNSSSIQRLILLFLASWMILTTISGQGASQSQQDQEIPADTIDYINFRQQPMIDNVTDTALNGNFHTTGWVENQWPHLMALGYNGSPVYDPHYHLPQDAGWNLGFNAFDPYRKSFDQLLFIRNGMPITKLTYTQTSQVNQSIFEGYFARKFNDLSFALHHHRFNFSGNYLNQRSFNTNFNTGFAINKENWFGYFLFASEVFDQLNNGGISNTGFFGNPIYENRSAFPVRFRNAASRDDTKKGKTGVMLKALQFGKYGVNTGVELNIDQRTITMNSARPDSTNYFPAYEFQRQEGFNSYMKHHSFFPGIILEFSDSTHSAFNLRSTTGLNINRLQNIKQSENWQEFVQKGDLDFQSEFFNVNAHLDLRIFNDNVYFDLNGQLATDWRGFGVSGYAGIKRTAAALNFYGQNFSGNPIWQRDPPASFHQILGGTLHFSSQQLQLMVKLEQLFQQNVSYFGIDGLPTVLDDQTTLSLQPEANLHLGIFHFKNQLTFYISENNLPYYPTLSGRHTLFIEDKWFKNRMHINLGVTAFWKNSHPAAYYLPYVQSFVPTSHRIDAEYHIVPFFAFRVRTFKFFTRFENINLMWQKNHALYDAYHYPLIDPTIRIGIEWLFRN